MTTDDAIQVVQARGLALNNLFWLNSGKWRANIRDPESTLFYEFGEADTPWGAIHDALAKAPGKPMGADARRENRPATPTPVSAGVLD